MPVGSAVTILDIVEEKVVSNMSYCRFQNTLSDLRDCYDSMSEDIELSYEEKRARFALIKLCCEIADDFEDELED